MWHGGMRILDKLVDAGARLLAERPSLTAADKALYDGRSAGRNRVVMAESH